MRSGISLAVASEILDIAKTRLRNTKSEDHDEQELAQLKSLASIVGSLKYQSIAASIKELAQDVDQDSLNTPLPVNEIIGLAYKARNELIHGGETTVDLSQLLVPLERLTAELCAGAILTVKECANILDCSERAVLRYIKDGKLKAAKRQGRWCIRPDELKLFMTSRA